MADPHAAPGVSIVMPAHRAEASIGAAVRSVLAQTHRNWELLIVADDEVDYEGLLGRAGIADRRISYLATGATGSGSPPARNLGLDHASNAIAAILDADDAFAPQKLERVLPHLAEYGVVSCALRIESAAGEFLRTVAAGADRVLDPGAYKFVNLSMDSMLVHDRRRADPRFDAGLPCLTDIDFLLKLLAKNETVFHIGEPLHTYVKHPQSISNKPGASADMIATKRLLRQRLLQGFYSLASPQGRDGLLRFYEISLAAEQSFGARLRDTPALLFEDHLEPMLIGR